MARNSLVSVVFADPTLPVFGTDAVLPAPACGWRAEGFGTSREADSRITNQSSTGIAARLPGPAIEAADTRLAPGSFISKQGFVAEAEPLDEPGMFGLTVARRTARHAGLRRAHANVAVRNVECIIEVPGDIGESSRFFGATTS
jgi:hypothetical protein